MCRVGGQDCDGVVDALLARCSGRVEPLTSALDGDEREGSALNGGEGEGAPGRTTDRVEVQASPKRKRFV